MTLIDVSIAFLAGLLIIPAMYVAQAQGVAIFAEDGSLISGSNLVFTVLPSLFSGMGTVGLFVGFGFFVLMTIAALTSSISMLEGPVSFVVERHNLRREKATTFIGVGIFLLSVIIIANISFMLDFVAVLATQYGQPIIAMLCCIFVGWIWHRNEILTELKQGHAEVEHSFFGKFGLGILNLFVQVQLVPYFGIRCDISLRLRSSYCDDIGLNVIFRPI